MNYVGPLTLMGGHPLLVVSSTQVLASLSIRSVEFSSLPSMENLGPERFTVKPNTII